MEFKKGQIIISIDLGTATTLNVVKYPGIFGGGIIAPGTDLMFKSLKMTQHNFLMLLVRSIKILLAGRRMSPLPAV